MKRAPFSIFCLLASILFTHAQPSGLVQKSASGSTSAVTYWEPGVRPAQIAAVDATSDKAASVLSFQAGTGVRCSALASALSTATNWTLAGGTLASNDVVLAVSGASVFPATIYRSTPTTNATLTLHNPLGTNCAVGTIVREARPTSALTVIQPVAAADNLYWLSSAGTLAAGDIVAFQYAPGSIETNVVSTIATNSLRRFTIAGGLLTDVAYDSAVREVTASNATLLAAVAVDGVTLHVQRTNAFVAGAKVGIRRDSGAWLIGTIDSGGVTATNITLAAAVGELAAGDTVWALTTQAYSVKYPAARSDAALLLDTATGLAAADRVLIAAADYTWESTVAAAATTNLTYTITCAGAAVSPMPEGTRLLPCATNIYTSTFAATATANAIALNGGTGIAASDYLVIMPAAGGPVMRQVQANDALTYQAVQLTAAPGTALAVGDITYKLGTSVTISVGAATLRTAPAWVLPQSAPARITVDGTSACTINSALVNYEMTQ